MRYEQNLFTKVGLGGIGRGPEAGEREGPNNVYTYE
jgi:hypothetical protein